jgi:hypothetical protein
MASPFVPQLGIQYADCIACRTSLVTSHSPFIRDCTTFVLARFSNPLGQEVLNEGVNCIDSSATAE